MRHRSSYGMWKRGGRCGGSIVLRRAGYTDSNIAFSPDGGRVVLYEHGPIRQGRRLDELGREYG